MLAEWMKAMLKILVRHGPDAMFLPPRVQAVVPRDKMVQVKERARHENQVKAKRVE